MPQTIDPLRDGVIAALACFLIALVFCAAPAHAQGAPRAQDRATIEACLKKESDTPARCIGAVYEPCRNRPPSDGDAFPPGSTPGMEACAAREDAVWQEKIDASLKALREGPLGQTEAQPYNRPKATKLDRAMPGTFVIDDMERAWETWRAKSCDVSAMRYEGGTFARTIYATCLFREAARHALWLKELESH